MNRPAPATTPAAGGDPGADYHTDVVAWIAARARLLRAGPLAAVEESLRMPYLVGLAGSAARGRPHAVV